MFSRTNLLLNNGAWIPSSIGQLVRHLCDRAQTVANLGVVGYFHRRLQYNRPGSSNSGLGMVAPIVALAQATRPQWRRTLRALGKVWNAVVGASLLLMPCAHIILILNQTRIADSIYYSDYLSRFSRLNLLGLNKWDRLSPLRPFFLRLQGFCRA